MLPEGDYMCAETAGAAAGFHKTLKVVHTLSLS
jgi:hypothetical protein